MAPCSTSAGLPRWRYAVHPMSRRRHGSVALTLAAALVAVPAAPSQRGPDLEWTVGATVRRFVPPGTYNWRGATTRVLQVGLWYPARSDSQITQHAVGPADSPLFRLGAWADDAPVAAGRFPLIVLSHGTGGSAEIMAWLARGLAARGYIVAAVNHPGNNALDEYTAEGFLVWWERARDLTTTIDLLLADTGLEPAIDAGRIGAAGFSLGGYTVVAVAGGLTDPQRFREFCRSASAEGCLDPPEFPGLFERWDDLATSSATFRNAVSEAARSFRDHRIKSVFAVAPALGPAFVPESLRDIAVPVAIIAGNDDRLVPVRSNGELLASLIPGATLALLPDVGHYTFLAACTEVGHRLEPQFCADLPGIDRETIHQDTVERAVRFFDDTLR